jgi:hypothetical protein
MQALTDDIHELKISMRVSPQIVKTFSLCSFHSQLNTVMAFEASAEQEPVMAKTFRLVGFLAAIL